MRPICSEPNNRRAASLIELVVACTIMAIVAAIAFEILIQGSRYLRINQISIDAQRDGLALTTQLDAGLQATNRNFISTSAAGVVFALPFKADGSTEFDPTSQKLVLQKWICYYYDAASGKVTLRERPIIPPSDNPGVTPTPDSFALNRVLKLVGSDISRFQFTQTSVTPPIWDVDITAGNMTDASSYGVELHTQVTPRN